MQSIISAQGLSKIVTTAAGPLTILNNISLTVAAGEALAITGSSGSGKSTLLGLLAGLDVPSSGQVLLLGQDLFTLDEEARAALRAAHLGFVFQSFQLLPNFTALENVMLPLELTGRENPREAAEEALARVGLTARRHHYPHQLSGGEQQRVAIARAFVVRPKLLFADEPTGNLDQRTGARIVDLLFSLNSDHAATLILVTHDEGIARHCGRRLELEAGRLKGQS